jgi:hypothetical protein
VDFAEVLAAPKRETGAVIPPFNSGEASLESQRNVKAEHALTVRG